MKKPNIYLKNLSITNFATFENQSISFNKGFNAIVGETGSGKSLILDSLNLIFGQRSDKKLIRKGSDFATIEAVFKSDESNINDFFDEIGFPIADDEIILKRVIYSNGRTKSFINFQQCQLNHLSTFSKRYVDLVGQFENQKLLSPNYQIRLLDSFCSLTEDVYKYQNSYNELSLLKNKLSSMKEQLEKDLIQEDFIKFQIDEIEKLNPSIEEENRLIKIKDSMKNVEKIHSSVFAISQILSENSEFNILNSLNQVKKLASNLQNNDTLLNDIESAEGILNDVYFNISKIDTSTFSEDEIEEAVDLLDQYQRLKRKYGGSVESICEKYNEFKLQKSNFDDLENSISSLDRSIEKLLISLKSKADTIHSKRTSGAKKLSKELSSVIQKLNMKNAVIDFNVKKIDELNPLGCTLLEFLAELNPGEGIHPVKNIASGGELSRILLALREVLSSKDSISVFLFDEIDAGIGGETALKIAQSLSNVSKDSQVIAITHLPQIAFQADQLISVDKKTIKGEELRTKSSVSLINNRSNINSYAKAMTPLQ